MGWLFHRGQGRQAWMAVGLRPRYPRLSSLSSVFRLFHSRGPATVKLVSPICDCVHGTTHVYRRHVTWCRLLNWIPSHTQSLVGSQTAYTRALKYIYLSVPSITRPRQWLLNAESMTIILMLYILETTIKADRSHFTFAQEKVSKITRNFELLAHQPTGACSCISKLKVILSMNLLHI